MIRPDNEVSQPTIEELMGRGRTRRQPGTIPGGPSSRPGPLTENITGGEQTTPDAQAPELGAAGAATSGIVEQRTAPGGNPASQMTPGGEQQPQMTPQGDGGVTPDEQNAYDEVLMAAEGELYGESHDDFVTMLRELSADPPAAIAQVTVLLLTTLDDAVNGQIPEEVILPAGAEITERVGNLANETGAFKVDQNIIGAAGQKVLIGLAEQYGVPEGPEIQALLDSVSPQEVERMRAEQEGYATPPAEAAQPTEGVA